MSLTTNPVVKTAGTLSVTGGTSITLSNFGTVGSVLTLGNAAATDFRLRETVKFQVKEARPMASAPNGTSQSRATATISVPKLLANGKYTVNSISTTLAFDPESSDADKVKLMDIMAQLLFGADYVSFWKSLSKG